MVNVLGVQEDQNGPRVIGTMTPQVVQTPREVDRDTVFYSHATDRTAQEVQPQVQAGLTSGLNIQANEAQRSGIQRALQIALEEEDVDPSEMVLETLDEFRQVEQFSRFLPSSMDAMIRAGEPGALEFSIDRLARIALTNDRIAERIEGMSTWGGVGLNIAETLLDPLSIIHSSTYRDLTRRYEALLSPTVSMEEFEQGLEEILNEAADAGFFSNENLFFFSDFLDTMGGGIYSGQQQVQELLGLVDLGLTASFEGVSLIRRGPQAIRTAAGLASTTALTGGIIARGLGGAIRDAGRDSLSAVSIMRPSSRTQRVVDETLERAVIMDDPLSSSTDISAHSHLSLGTPTLTRGALWSAPVHDAVRRFELTSGRLDELMDAMHRVGHVYDEDTFIRFRNQFVRDRLDFLAQSGARGIIDVEVGVDEASNIFSVDVIGRVNGQYFRTEQAASRVLEEGDEIVQVGDSQYAVIRRNNISADNLQTARDLGYSGDIRGLMLYRATDPEQLGQGFWARFGSPGAQGDPQMNTALFRGESVFQDTLHRIRSDTRRVVRSMRGREVSETYRVFDHMQSLPRREAFTREEFTSWFTGEYGRPPTQNQTSLYLLEQERLDAELFISSDRLYKSAVSNGVQSLRIGDTSFLVRPISQSALPEGARILDEDSGRLLRVREIGDRQVYRNVGTTEFPQQVQYLVSENPAIRAVRHSDFMARNAGGHRAYITSQMQVLVKQPNTRVYSDLTEREMAPRTLLGARTAEEARKATNDINNIIDGVLERLNPSPRVTDDVFDSFLDSYFGNRHLDELVRANNGFNPQISNFEDLVTFFRDRGLSLRTRFTAVPEGEPIGRMLDKDVDFSGFAFTHPDFTHLDDVRLNTMRGGRGSLPLTRYGGGTVDTRATQDVLEGSYISNAARAHETVYRVKAFKGIVRSALEAGVLRDGYRDIASLPIRAQVERILRDDLIDVSGATGTTPSVGARLRLDLQRLQFRMQERSWTTRFFENQYRNFANFLYSKNFRWGADKVDRFSTDPASALRGWAFDAYLGMFNMSQLFMQASQIINIIGVSGTTGFKAASLYTPFRFVLANGNDAVLERVARLTQSLTDLSPDDWRTMVRMFKESGRHIVDNNLAELSMAEDAMSGLGRIGVTRGVRNFREAGRFFYKEGDLAARITAFITSYMEYVAKNGPITNPRDRRAISFITNREQTLTQYMTAASRQGYEQAPFMQFMTYNLRITEALFAGTFSNTKSVLTASEKVRLATTHLAMWGAAASAPTNLLMGHLENNYNIDMNEHMLRGIRSGALDAIVSWITGSDTAISARFSSGNGWWELMRQMAEENVLSIFAGPSGQLAWDTGRVTLRTLYASAQAMFTGNFVPTQDALIDIARLTSSGNYTYNAYTAYRTGLYMSRRDSIVAENLTAMDAMFTLFGIPLEEIDSIYSYHANRRFRTQWLERTIVPSLNRLHEQHTTAIRNDDPERARHYAVQIGILMQSLDPTERSIVDARVNPDFRSMQNSILLDILMQNEGRGTEMQELTQ